MNESFIDKGDGHLGKVYKIETDAFYFLSHRLPGVQEKVINPVTLNREKLWEVVVLLNDCYGWTRDQIADWLDKIDEEGEVDVTFKDNPHT